MRWALAFILVACAIAGGVVLTTGGHGRHAPRLSEPRLTVTAARGSDAATLHWTAFAARAQASGGYDVFLNGARVGSTTQQSWTFNGLDCGSTFQLAVQAHGPGSDVSQRLAASYTTPSCPPVHVGAPTPPGVTCTQKLDPGADVEGALSAASPGDVICLNPGSWGAITLSGITPDPPGVILAATPGETVVVPGITLTGAKTQNLTIEGFSITRPGNGNNNGIQLLCGISGGVTIRYNTIENQPNGYGIYAYARSCGSDHTQTGVTVADNQIDHVGSGIQINGGRAEELDWTISHNVIGPDIQYQGYGHYIEIGGVDMAAIDHNAFEGPPDPHYENPTSHLNVLHVDNGKSNLTFASNIIWHCGCRAQTVLIQDTPMDNITIENNLDVEDPSCETDSNCYTSPLTIYAAHGLTFEHNTFVNGAWSISLAQTGLGYSDPRNMTAMYNIAGPASALGADQPNYSDWACTKSCLTGPNVSADRSADSTLGGTGNVVGWSPSWKTTSWMPVSGPGYKPPPPGYYQPVGLAIAGAGYRGHVGP